jgi:hypothetical protein
MMGALAAEPTSIVTAVRQASVSSLTSVLRVDVPGDVGYLFFLEGALVHAATLDLEGEQAALTVLGWEVATLAWCERRWPRERSVHRGWAELVEQLPASDVTAPPPEIAMRPTPTPVEQVTPSAPPPAQEVHFPSSFGIRRALAHTDFKNALRLGPSGTLGDTRGSSSHLKPILRAAVVLGDSLGSALGFGPLIAAEASASAPALHLLIARSAEDSSAIETSGGEGLQLARAFLKL